MVWCSQKLSNRHFTRHLKHLPLHQSNTTHTHKDRPDTFITGTNFAKGIDLSKISSNSLAQGSWSRSQEHATIRVAKQLTVRAETESPEIVVTFGNELMTIE